MDAADLFYGVFRDDPQAAVLIQVPLASVVVTDLDILDLRVFLATPWPAVTSNNPCFVSMIFSLDGLWLTTANATGNTVRKRNGLIRSFVFVNIFCLCWL